MGWRLSYVKSTVRTRQVWGRAVKQILTDGSVGPLQLQRVVSKVNDSGVELKKNRGHSWLRWKGPPVWDQIAGERVTPEFSFLVKTNFSVKWNKSFIDPGQIRPARAHPPSPQTKTQKGKSPSHLAEWGSVISWVRTPSGPWVRTPSFRWIWLSKDPLIHASWPPFKKWILAS